MSDISTSSATAAGKEQHGANDVMKAAIGKDYGCIEAQFGFTDEYPRVRLDPRLKKYRLQLAVRVQAVGVAPGDPRVMHGAQWSCCFFRL